MEPIAAALRPAPLRKVLGYVTPLPNGKLVFSGGGQVGGPAWVLWGAVDPNALLGGDGAARLWRLGGFAAFGRGPERAPPPRDNSAAPLWWWFPKLPPGQTG